MRKKNGTRGINLPDFRLYYKATVNKTVWSWQRDRNIDEWNKREKPEKNPCTYMHLKLTKEARIHNGEKTISLPNCAWKTGQPLGKELFKLYMKGNTKWIKDLNIRPETINLLEENIGKMISEITHSRIP